MPPYEFVDGLRLAARRKLNAPPEWEWYRASVLRPYERHETLVRGGIPARRKDGSVRKGSAKWAGVPHQECVITRADIAFEMAEYERTTGRCAECAGRGERVTGTAYRDGVVTRTWNRCRKCAGRGVPSSVVLAVDPSRSTPPAVAQTALFAEPHV